MYKLSFKVRHRNCAETGLSIKFPKHHITVVDIQSTHPKEKQYFYYITGNPRKFDEVVSYLHKAKGFKLVEEIERSTETLLLLVVISQKGYIQNVIQKYHGFFIDLHTVSHGYEYWHIGVVDRQSIDKIIVEAKKMGLLKVLYIGEVGFEHSLLSQQQKKIFKYAYDKGYYSQPRKVTILRIAKAMKLSPATAGEHLLKAENKLINSIARKI
ncbi:hypothetical protein GOV09_03240 [Candidatus Woesearchaeota archaeon]|nr:hypothetical protein [Candidatus Woesearchaeota archaeon]